MLRRYRRVVNISTFPVLFHAEQAVVIANCSGEDMEPLVFIHLQDAITHVAHSS
jgi:hypothetical protein